MKILLTISLSFFSFLTFADSDIVRMKGRQLCIEHTGFDFSNHQLPSKNKALVICEEYKNVIQSLSTDELILKASCSSIQGECGGSYGSFFLLKTDVIAIPGNDK